MEAADEGVDRIEDSKDLQQQSKAFDQLTDRVEDRQLDSTRVQEAMASIAASAEADWNAMRLRHSCGVHVISWLRMWDGSEHGADGYTMPHYTDEELRELKVGFLWWLVTHPRNNHRQKVLSLMEDYHKKLKRH